MTIEAWNVVFNNLPSIFNALVALVSACLSGYAAFKATQTHTIVSGGQNGPTSQSPSK